MHRSGRKRMVWRVFASSAGGPMSWRVADEGGGSYAAWRSFGCRSSLWRGVGNSSREETRKGWACDMGVINFLWAAAVDRSRSARPPEWRTRPGCLFWRPREPT